MQVGFDCAPTARVPSITFSCVGLVSRRAFGGVLFLPERPPGLIRQRLEEIRQHRALVGPDECLDRHPGY